MTQTSETLFQVRMMPEIQQQIRAFAASKGWTLKQATEGLILLGLIETGQIEIPEHVSPKSKNKPKDEL